MSNCTPGGFGHVAKAVTAARKMAPQVRPTNWVEREASRLLGLPMSELDAILAEYGLDPTAKQFTDDHDHLEDGFLFIGG